MSIWKKEPPEKCKLDAFRTQPGSSIRRCSEKKREDRMNIGDRTAFMSIFDILAHDGHLL